MALLTAAFQSPTDCGLLSPGGSSTFMRMAHSSTLAITSPIQISHKR